MPSGTPLMICRGRLLPPLAAIALAGPWGAAAADCLPGPERLCLQDSRFEATVSWTNPYPPGGSGTGHPVPLTDEAGYFWFFRQANIEWTVKLLDGRPVSGSFWFFAASMSTLGMSMDVLDTRSGWFRRFHNPPLRQTTINDTLPDGVPLGSRLLFVGAHPDDETLVAPLLGHLCRNGSRECSLLVATEGENGACGLPGGCLPDLGSVRRAEMARSAAYLGATLIQRRLPDLPGPDPGAVRAAWAQAEGGEEALLTSLATAIAAAAPEAILVFDPRHGSTCHPAHRAIGRLVLDAVTGLGPTPPGVFLIETFARRVTDPPIELGPAVRDEGSLAGFDASRQLEGSAAIPWEHLLAVAGIHASQFSSAQLASLAAQPSASRRVYLLPATAGLTDPRYELCGD
jgi:LmbE family N-acetylglucosaminyl deacetylase